MTDIAADRGLSELLNFRVDFVVTSATGRVVPFTAYIGDPVEVTSSGRSRLREVPPIPLKVPKLGSTIPKMGRRTRTTTRLADALFPRVQGRVLGILFGQPDRSFQGSELIAMAESGTGAVHRVLGRLAESGLVTVMRTGRQKHYRANRESPVFGELHGLVIKTVGLAGPLGATLAPFARKIRAAFVYGSIAKGTDTARSDIDLMVIAEGLEYPELYEALQKAEETLRRTVSPNLMTVKEWKRKVADGNPFVARVWAQPKLFVIGSENALA